MSPPVEFQLDTGVNALYTELGSGAVARTIALTDAVHADVDAEGTTLGIEVIDADAFVPFRKHAADERPEVRELFRLTSA